MPSSLSGIGNRPNGRLGGRVGVKIILTQVFCQLQQIASRYLAGLKKASFLGREIGAFDTKSK